MPIIYEGSNIGYRVLSRPLRDILIITLSYQIFNFHQASLAWYWSFKLKSYLRLTGLSKDPILIIYEGPNIGYRVQASLLNGIPILTVHVLNKLSYFH